MGRGGLIVGVRRFGFFVVAIVALLGPRGEICGLVCGKSLCRVDAHGVPSPGCLGYLRIFQTQQAWDGRAGEVDVKDPDGLASEREGEG